MAQLLLFFVLCSLCASSNYRTLQGGEGGAFRAVWGVCDAETLMRIQKNLPEYWKEREDALLHGTDKALNHKEFRQRYVQEAKEHIRTTLASTCRLFWFKGPEDIEEVIKEYIEEGSDLFEHFQFIFLADTCDYLFKRTKQNNKIASAAELRQVLSYASEDLEAVRNFLKNYDRLLWLVTPSGSFSLFDYLVMRSKRYHLCSALLNPQDRARASWHDQFFGWFGAYAHDVTAHAQSSLLYEDFARKNGVCYQQYFDACCNPEALSGGDIVTMSQRVIGCFSQFHEFPSSETCSYLALSKIFDVIFPDTRELTDPGFRDIVPYFRGVPVEHNWLEQPLEKSSCSDRNIHDTIMEWVALSCYQGLRFLKTDDRYSYFVRLRRDVDVSSLKRFPHFVDHLIELSYSMETPSAREVPLCSFVPETKRLAEACATELIRLKESATSSVISVYASFSVSAAVVAMCGKNVLPNYGIAPVRFYFLGTSGVHVCTQCRMSHTVDGVKKTCSSKHIASDIFPKRC